MLECILRLNLPYRNLIMPRVLLEKSPSPMKLEVLGVEVWPLTHHPVARWDRYLQQTETSYIVSGAGEIRVQNEDPVQFTAGDLITVMPDTECVWHITEAIERHYKKG